MALPTREGFFFDADAKPVQAFYWGVYKQRTSRWIKGYNCSIGYMGNENGRVYGKTIPYLAKTCLQRTGLPELIHANMKTDPEKYLVVDIMITLFFEIVIELLV